MLADGRASGESDNTATGPGTANGAAFPSADALPLVSVVIPTFNRPRMLAHAVESVLAQTETRWELIISDDEAHPGAGRSTAESYAAADPRVRVVANDGPHGQCGNLNNAMGHARAEWIKPLYDDDALRPDCLRIMLNAVTARPGVVLARCLADHYEGRRPRRVHRLGALPALQRLDSASARLAMLLQDVEIGMPTQVLVRAATVRGGVLMQAPHGLVIGVDWWWFARLLEHGDLMLVNRALVEEHQGDHATVTSTASRAFLYEEMRRLRRDILPLVPAPARPPDSSAAEAIVSLVEAAAEARAGRLVSALRRAASVRSARGWALTARLLLRRLFPGRFELIPRLPPAGRPPAAADMLAQPCPPALSASHS